MFAGRVLIALFLIGCISVPWEQNPFRDSYEFEASPGKYYLALKAPYYVWYRQKKSMEVRLAQEWSTRANQICPTAEILNSYQGALGMMIHHARMARTKYRPYIEGHIRCNQS